MTETYPEKILKFCPRCSGRFIPQEDFSLICQSCGMHFYSNTCAAVCALIYDREGRLLVTVRAYEPKKGMLDLPGGFVSPLESIEEALKREVDEELGVKVTDIKYLCSFPNRYVYSGLTYFTIDLAFICNVDNISKIKPADDVEDVSFMDAASINPDDVAFDSIRNIIKFTIK